MLGYRFEEKQNQKIAKLMNMDYNTNDESSYYNDQYTTTAKNSTILPSVKMPSVNGNYNSSFTTKRSRANTSMRVRGGDDYSPFTPLK
jgi:hypothetical protein